MLNRNISGRALSKRIKNGVLVAFTLAAMGSHSVADEVEFPEQARDLMYGEALYHYYQGQSFEALTLLNVAKLRGGVKGHSEHPLLVEGGLLLAYGMVSEAQVHFETVLADELAARVPATVRNQAWFYLAKVHYLTEDLTSAQAALKQLDADLLSDDAPENYDELQYIKAQIALRGESDLVLATEAIDRLPENSLWRFYLQYNRALLDRAGVENDELLTSHIEGVLSSLSAIALSSEAEQNERDALADRLRLTLGQLYLQNQLFEQAAGHLKRISFDSPFAEQALFNYAVAKAHQKEFSVALSALNRLKDSRLFTPWLQQVPYALAYLYEQMGETALALQAYRSAAEHYDNQLALLAEQKASLSEQGLITALTIPFDASGSSTDKLTASPVLRRRSLELGAEHIENDAYGRLNVQPDDYAIAALLSGEQFQWALRDLHELYKLMASLNIWERQLESFDLMLETRRIQRTSRLETVAETLTAQRASSWVTEQKKYQVAIDAALDVENEAFFMDTDQIEFAEQIALAKATLALLPDDEDKIEYTQKLARVEGYFTWWVADRYGVNRWQAQSQLKQLNQSMDEFLARHRVLEAELENDDFQRELVNRVVDGKRRLAELKELLTVSLDDVREQMLSQLRDEIDAQIGEVSKYRLASRHAQARIADNLFLQSKNAEQSVDNEAEDAAQGEGESTSELMEVIP